MWLLLALIILAGAAVAASARGVRYAQLGAGHAAENLFLQATALGIATVVVGAFDDAAVTRLLRLEPGKEPLVLMPLGRRPEGR